MDETTRVNFHCHSIFSDGESTPEALAESFAAAWVRYAALTDHDSVDGQTRFQEALKRRGIGFITGVEMTTQCHGREAHLLGYGFNPNHPELKETLTSLRQMQVPGVQSITGILLRKGTNNFPNSANEPMLNAAPDGRISIEEAINLIHRAGGKAFFAHPLIFNSDLNILDDLFEELKVKGLDGLEVFYELFSDFESEQLLELAKKHGFLICGGTDSHGIKGVKNSVDGMDIPTEIWQQFRKAVCLDSIISDASHPDIQAPEYAHRNLDKHLIGRSHLFRRRFFLLRIYLPTLLAIALFLATIWGLILPSFERTLLDRKREMIKELTNSAWSILASYERDERAGLITQQEAQRLAISRIESLRYGKEGKDYFWLQDMTPFIIMHPYRKDLNGQDVSQFTDPRGVRIFVEFADLVQRKGEGYIEYVWQWKDDPQRLEAKESYIKGFEPWGWIIGTGIYIEDVNIEIARIEQNLVRVSLIIFGIVTLLLLFVVQQSLRIERERQDAEEGLRESTERYRSLVEATTEGTLLVLEGHCRYANPTFLKMLGYNMRQLEMLDIADLLPHEEDNETAWENITRLSSEPGGSGGIEGVLKHADGRKVDCILALTPISFVGNSGFILLAKDVVTHIASGTDSEDHQRKIAQLAQSAPIGLFRTNVMRRAMFIEMNAAAYTLTNLGRSADMHQLSLADLFQDPAEYEEFRRKLYQDNVIQDYPLPIDSLNIGTRTLSLSTNLIRDEQGRPSYIVGMIKDITDVKKFDADREALIEKLQTSLLFLNEPVGHFGRHIVLCKLETPIEEVASLMTKRDSSAVLVETESGAVIGIVTDHDLRQRVIAEGVDPRMAVRTVMSAPLVTISEHALIYEALLKMEEKGVQHLAVEDETGQIIGIIRNKELIQFHRYGLSVLTREIARSKTPAEVVRCCERVPLLVKALVECGARARNITHIISTICDAAVERFIALAFTELGEPPVEFAFIAMGSHGRMEQTLLTDQDNAIIYLDQEDTAAEKKVEDYFLRLGTKVCDWLEQAGYPRCKGEVMASNPRWCCSVEDWKRYFRDWINKAEPQELLDFNIFFDFRAVYGKADMVHELRRYVFENLEEHPSFFIHLAQNSLQFTPPFRLFGKIFLGGGSGDHSGQLNMKDTLLSIVNFARLYALNHKVIQTHTLDRIDALVEKNVLLQSSRDEMNTSYEFLMRLRLQHQIVAFQNGIPMDNIVNTEKLGHMEEALLKQAIAQISALQKKISYDFLGGTK